MNRQWTTQFEEAERDIRARSAGEPEMHIYASECACSARIVITATDPRVIARMAEGWRAFHECRRAS